MEPGGMAGETAGSQGLYFEEFEGGATYLSRSETVTEEAVVRFALEWDPQPFHTDRAAAAQSFFGRLTGSGLHTIVLTSRLFHDLGLISGTAVAGRGFDESRFLKPLYPGDTLHVKATILDRETVPDRAYGRVRIRMETMNQDGVAIYRTILTVLVACRPGDPANESSHEDQAKNDLRKDL